MNPSVSRIVPPDCVPESGSVAETEQMAAFVAALTDDQRAKLLALLMGC